MRIAVTGGNGKLAQAVLPWLIAQKHELLVNDRSQQAQDKPFPTTTYDLSTHSGAASFLSACHKHLGPMDALINLMGFLSTQPAFSFTQTHFRKEMEINLYAPFMLMQQIEQDTLRVAAPFSLIHFTLCQANKVYRKIVFHAIAKNGLESLCLSYNKRYKATGRRCFCVRLPDMQKQALQENLPHALARILQNPAAEPAVIKTLCRAE